MDDNELCANVAGRVDMAVAFSHSPLPDGDDKAAHSSSS
jgi:hypothetical protein